MLSSVTWKWPACFLSTMGLEGSLICVSLGLQRSVLGAGKDGAFHSREDCALKYRCIYPAVGPILSLYYLSGMSVWRVVLCNQITCIAFESKIIKCCHLLPPLNLPACLPKFGLLRVV